MQFAGEVGGEGDVLRGCARHRHDVAGLIAALLNGSPLKIEVFLRRNVGFRE
jgi:hypothetical protein